MKSVLGKETFCDKLSCSSWRIMKTFSMHKLQQILPKFLIVLMVLTWKVTSNIAIERNSLHYGLSVKAVQIVQ